jgi:RNAse (barnase) inhibitor barstar
VPRVRLLGCQLEPPAAIGQAPEAGRRIRAEVHAVAADGSARRVLGAVVSGTVEASEPSGLGAGLIDVTVHSDPTEPLPTGILDILAHRRTGGPTQNNQWAGYDRALRHHWAGVALTHRSDAPDQPADTTYDLDGRFVTDVEGFYCAIGEAINGPGGYFGWNLDALDDCLRGGFGAQTPFRLVWHDSAVAHEHLTGGYDRLRLRPAVTFDYLLDMLTAHHIEIDLR